jgi:aspartate carbamoyltransferase catalytic subunit
MKPIKLKHLLSVEDLSLDEVIGLIERANDFKQNQTSINLKQTVYTSNLFFENSTRTHRSFEMAERKLGLEVIQFDASTSSVNKGETLYDTVLTMCAIGIDIAVIRHSQEAYYNELIHQAGITCSIINGGDGRGQHPTQCLLDLMTIQNEFNRFEGLNIAIVGDIRNSRVARSNAILLNRLGAKVSFCGPEVWFDESFNEYGRLENLDDILAQLDVIMLLRVQHERHDKYDLFSKETYHSNYGLTMNRYHQLKPSCIVMHPAPVNRDSELASECVEAPQSRIVEQMRNGVFMRMAILEAICAYRGLIQ